MRNAPQKYCSLCGAEYHMTVFPLVCHLCGKTVWHVPVPLTFGVIPVGEDMLVTRRAVEPHINKLCLPGGYVDADETMRHACSREILEETGLSIPETKLTLFQEVAERGMLIHFFIAPQQSRKAIDTFTPNEEVCELLIVPISTILCFSSHTKVLKNLKKVRQTFSNYFM